MKRITLLLLIAGSFMGAAIAQTDIALDPEFGARVSVGMDWKIVRGLHLTLSEQVRFDNNFSDFDRLQTQLGLSYKVNPYFKFGAGYMLNVPFSSGSGAFKSPRHRLYADVKGTARAGKWAFSLKERFQWTYRQGDMNEYQYPRNALTLKSRLMVKYNGRKAAPYAYFELRNFLNAPVIYANFDGTNYVNDDGSATDVAGWFLHSFKGGYVNRYRGCVGVDLKFNKHNALDVYFLADGVNDKVVDANSSGTKLKSYTREHGFVGGLGVEYTFSF